MPDEVRQISITVQATQAIQSLVRMGTALDGVQSLVGKTDAQLRRAEGVIQRTAVASRNAANTIGQLKAALKAANAETRAAEQQNQRLATSLQRAGSQLDAVRTKLAATKDTIYNLRQANRQAEAQINSQLIVIKRQGREYQNLKSKLDAAAASQRAFNAAQKAGLAGQFAKAAPLAVSPLGTITKNGTVPLAAMAAPAVAAGLTRTASGLGGIAAGATAASKALSNFENGFANSLRYQLFSLVALFGVAGLALTGLAKGFNSVGISWDKNFANVVRTSQVTGVAVEYLKEQFLELQSAVPVTSADLAKIGTLGAQMGVAATELAKFTTVTAQFAATAGIGVDEAATALSRLNELLPDVHGNYERLASTILKTGVNAVATEQQIVRGVSQIASIGRVAGLTTPEIVGLASALSSLGFSPELQRSVITSSFSRILAATSRTTAATEKFGAVLHMTGDEFRQAWGADAVGTFERLMKAIASRGDAVSVLKDLGLASQRLTPNLLKLGQNTSVLDETLRDTAIGWKENSELQRQYGVISGTVAAKLQILGQSWEALLVTLNDSGGVLGGVIDILTGFVKLLRQIAQAPGLSTMVTLGTVIAGLSGVFLLAVGAMALFTTGYITMINANLGLKAALAEEIAARAAVGAAQQANLLGLGEELVLREGVTAATYGQTVALNGTTVATTGAAGAATLMGTRVLGMQSAMLLALPKIFAFTAAIGAAAVIVTGLGVLLATAPTWQHDLDKAFSGVNTIGDTLDFDVSKIKKLGDEIKKSQDFLNQSNAIQNIRSENALQLKIQERKAVIEDLTESILELGNTEDQYAAINDVSKALNLSQQEFLDLAPDLQKALGGNAAALAEEQDEMVKLADATNLWAGILGSTESDVTALKKAVQTGSADFINFNQALLDAFDDDGANGEGFGSFITNIDKQIADFEAFTGNLGTLVQRGGVQLATLFAGAGPVATQALSDSLNLTPDQIAQIENQMSLAAFYASEAFANSFAQNNAILASVFQQTGSTEAVSAFNSAFNEALRNQTSISPQTLADLEKRFNVKLDVRMIPDVDPDEYEAAVQRAGATITPIKVPVTTSVGQGDFTATREVDAWVVEMNGKTLVMETDPDTAAGTAEINKWQAEQNNKALTMHLGLNTSAAQASLNAFRAQNLNLVAYIRKVDGGATGALVHNGALVHSNYPKFARGTVLRGPGTGTSDSILARVSNGEAITRAAAVRYYGSKFFDDLNRMRIPRFAQGHTPAPQSTGTAGAAVVSYVNINNPVTRDPIKDLRENAQNAVAGVWA